MLMRTSDEISPGITRNRILESLDEPDNEVLRMHSHRIMLRRGDFVARSGDDITMMIFPEDCLISLTTDDGACNPIEEALAGSEGMVGWPALLGCGRMPHDATVEMKSGRATVVPIKDMLEACRNSEKIRTKLGLYIHTVMVQMSHTIRCHANDELGQRLARWLLMRHDRMIGDDMMIRHEEIAKSLTVRRASVTNALHVLEGEHLLVCRRGRLKIRDRPALAAYASASYGVPETTYSNLLTAFGK